MGEHGFAGNVADGQDVRIARPLLFVSRYKTLRIDLDLRVLKPQARTVGTAAYGNQYSAEPLGSLALIVLEADFDGIPLVGKPDHFGVQIDARKDFADVILQRFYEISIGPR
jgi:hypothetical protein